MTRHPPITCASTTFDDSLVLVEETSPPCTPPVSHHSTPDNHGAHVLVTTRLLEGGDNGQEATEDSQDDHETMTTSALIAHRYRLSAERESEGMQPSSTGYHASCPNQRAADTRSITAAIEDEAQDPDEKLQKRAEYSLSVHAMLCSVPPSIIDNTRQPLSKITQEDNEQHSVLYQFRRVPHTIVIDSFRPSLAPHIVITPPPDTWEDSTYDNRINPQNMTCLYVPPYYLSTCRTPTYEEWKAIVYPPPQVQCRPSSLFGAFNYPRFCRNMQRAMAETSSVRTRAASLATHQLLRRYAAIAASQQASTFCRKYLCEYIDSTRKLRIDPKKMVPQRVFSLSAFKAFVEHTSDERAHPMTQAAVYGTHRLLLRLEAIKASSIATEWRSRYDDAQFIASVDRRFSWKWNDPAEPVFSHLGPRPVNVTVIHSTYPCSAPHIVIHGTEPNDPWITWGNSTDVQDCAYDNALVVVSAKGVPLTYVNVTGDEPNNYFGDLSTCDYDEFGGSGDTSSLCSSSSGPSTPTGLQRIGSGFFSEAVEENLVKCRYESYSSYISGFHEDFTSSTSDDNSYHSHSTTLGHTSSGKFYFADDDDDDVDGPPEYDEWFISIASRTGLAGQAGLVVALPI